MEEIKKYKGSIPMAGGLYPASGGEYPLINTALIEKDSVSGQRLDKYLEEYPYPFIYVGAAANKEALDSLLPETEDSDNRSFIAFNKGEQVYYARSPITKEWTVCSASISEIAESVEGASLIGIGDDVNEFIDISSVKAYINTGEEDDEYQLVERQDLMSDDTFSKEEKNKIKSALGIESGIRVSDTQPDGNNEMIDVWINTSEEEEIVELISKNDLQDSSYFTDNQKSLVKEAIGAIGVEEQTFTDEQKAQARKNIDASVNIVYRATDYGISTEADDNTLALQALIDNISEAGGGIIFFPIGTYNFLRWNSPDYRWAIEMKSNVSIIGENLEKTILKQTQKMPYSMFGRILDNHGGAEDPLTGCTFQNFTIDAYDTGDTNHVCGKAFFFQYVRDCVFRDLRLMGTTATAMGIDFIDRVVIDNVTCIDCGRTFTGTEAGTSGIGIGTCGWENENFVITNCVCVGCGQYGIFIENQGLFHDGKVDYSKGCIISNCIVRNGINKGIGVRGGQNVTVIGCETYENTSHGIYIDNNCKNVKVISCSSSNNQGAGIFITPNASEHLFIKNCTVLNNQSEGIKVNVETGKNADKLCITDCYTDGNTIGIDLSASYLLDCVILGNATLDGVNNNTIFNGNTTFNDLINADEPAEPDTPVTEEIKITGSMFTNGKKLMPVDEGFGYYGNLVDDNSTTWIATESFIDISSLNDNFEVYYDTCLGSDITLLRVVQYSDAVEPTEENHTMALKSDGAIAGETDGSTYHKWTFRKADGCRYIRLSFQYNPTQIFEATGVLRNVSS